MLKLFAEKIVGKKKEISFFSAPSGGNAVGVTEPDGALALGALVVDILKDDLAAADVKDIDLLVLARRDEEVAVVVEGKRLNHVGVADELCLKKNKNKKKKIRPSLHEIPSSSCRYLLDTLGDVPQLDGQVATSRGKGVVSSGVELDKASFAGVSGEDSDGLGL